MRLPNLDPHAVTPRVLALAVLEEADRADAAEAEARELRTHLDRQEHHRSLGTSRDYNAALLGRLQSIIDDGGVIAATDWEEASAQADALIKNIWPNGVKA